MKLERINPAELGRPSGFSQAVSATASRMVFLAGQLGTGPGGKVVTGGGVAQFEQALANLLTALAAAGGQPAGLGSKADRGGVVAQFEQALANLLTALAAAGGQPADLVSLTIYLTDVEDYQAHGRQIGAVWRQLAGTEYPAMAGVGVTRLWDPEALVEIQGTAAVSR